MDKLFSGLQEKFKKNKNKNKKKNILKKTQTDQEKITELLNNSVKSLICGPKCQKLKVTEQLKQKYLAAETNMQTAPIVLEQTKKNYYVYSEGKPEYDNMLEEELKEKAIILSDSLTEVFNNEVSNAKTMNQYLNTALINSGYTTELLEDYITKNQELALKLKNSYGDILTNDRKTYYEIDALNRLALWYKFWWYIYYILVVVFVIALFISPSLLTIPKKFVILIFIVFYPYYIDYIVEWFNDLFHSIYINIPKNVYNTL